MENTLLDNPEEYFSNLGGLHDARIEGVNWSLSNKKIIVSIDDINSNFEGLPNYKGLVSANILFNHVHEFKLNFSLEEHYLSIYDLEIVSNNLDIIVNLKCWPEGVLQVRCKSIGVLKL